MLIRAIEVLEHQATPEARRLLDLLAKDSKEIIKNEAQGSLARLAQREAKKPGTP